MSEREEGSETSRRPAPVAAAQPDRADLRSQAEKRVVQRAPSGLESLSPAEIRRMVHELQVHQIELEMQNEELRRAQAELSLSQVRYFDLYDLAPVGYATLSQKGLIIEANLTVAGLLGLDRSRLMQQPLTRFILAEDQDCFYGHRKRLFETGQPQACELRMQRQGGAAFWAHLEAALGRDAADRPVCRFVMNDITERKRLEDELRQSHQELEARVQQRTAELQQSYAALSESEQRFGIIIRTALDGFWRFDAQCRILEVNESLCRMTGYSEAELLTMSIGDLDITETPAETFAHAHRLRAQGADRFETRFRRKDGSCCDVEVSAQYRAEVGDWQIAFLRDITERKRAEEMTRLFSQEVIAAREQERKQLSSALHHDVGSLAVGVSAYLDALEADLRAGRPQAALACLAQTRKLFDDAVARLKELAVQLRPPELDTLGLCAALRQHVAQVAQHRGIQVRFREALGRRLVTGDAAAILFRIAQEAVNNALKHGRAQRIDVDLRARRGEITLTVADHGAGFDPSQQEAHGTSQIGLRAMREMAALADGVLTIESTPDKGTTVRARLPIAE